MPNKPNIVLWDLETSNLNANYGFILCAGWKKLGQKKTHVIKISDFPLYKKKRTNDREVARAMRDVLIDADGCVTWFGKYFDIPFLNSRLLAHGLDPMPPFGSTHVDGWRIARNHLKLNSNRLNVVSEFINSKERKSPVLGPEWIDAMAGDKQALKYVYEHCRKDVEVLEEVYNKIKILDPNHFNINLGNETLDACPKCGTVGHLEKRGFRWARVSKTQRYKCNACGAWSTGAPQRVKGIEIR